MKLSSSFDYKKIEKEKLSSYKFDDKSVVKTFPWARINIDEAFDSRKFNWKRILSSQKIVLNFFYVNIWIWAKVLLSARAKNSLSTYFAIRLDKKNARRILSGETKCFSVHLIHYINKVGNFFIGRSGKESEERKTHLVRIPFDKLPGKLFFRLIRKNIKQFILVLVAMWFGGT